MIVVAVVVVVMVVVLVARMMIYGQQLCCNVSLTFTNALVEFRTSHPLVPFHTRLASRIFEKFLHALRDREEIVRWENVPRVMPAREQP